MQTYRSGRNLETPHPPEAYPGLRVVRIGRWPVNLITPTDGQTISALGGERVIGYETVDGGKAEGFELLSGDRATLVRSDLPFFFAEWRIERASPK